MSFWYAGGEDVRQTVTAETSLGNDNDFDPIPDNTKVLAIVDEAGKKADNGGNEHAYANLTILKPAAYANRKIFAKFWVFDDNPHAADKEKKRRNDMERFVKLDIATGGKLTRSSATPDDGSIATAFTNKEVIVQVMLMKDKDKPEEKGNNWYKDYWPKGIKEITEVASPSKPKPRTPEPSNEVDDDDEIPF